MLKQAAYLNERDCVGRYIFSATRKTNRTGIKTFLRTNVIVLFVKRIAVR